MLRPLHFSLGDSPIGTDAMLIIYLTRFGMTVSFDWYLGDVCVAYGVKHPVGLAYRKTLTCCSFHLEI